MVIDTYIVCHDSMQTDLGLQKFILMNIDRHILDHVGMPQRPSGLYRLVIRCVGGISHCTIIVGLVLHEDWVGK